MPPAAALVPPLLHTCTRGTLLPPAATAAASQTRRRAVTFHPAPSARRRVGSPARSRTAGLRVPFPLHLRTSMFLLGFAFRRHLPPPIPYDATCGACRVGLGGKSQIFPLLPHLSHFNKISLPRPWSSQLVVSSMTFKRSCFLIRFYKGGSSKCKEACGRLM